MMTSPIRRLLSRELEREGYRTYELNSATNLFGELQKTPVDLLITDLDLPHQEGLETLAGAKARVPGLANHRAVRILGR